MTKADIVERLYEKTSLPKKDVVDILEDVFEVMKSTLESGEKIKVAGFGNFAIKQKKDRTGRNPVTGEAMTIMARKVLTFKPSAILKAAINR
jgi:integration host factor subunit alpha